MIFLISYLSVRKRQGRELLATGGAFTLGIFLAYLGVGLGLLKFLTTLPALNAIGKWLYGLTLVLCLALAWGSLSDYRKARAGRLEDMSLKLPSACVAGSAIWSGGFSRPQLRICCIPARFCGLHHRAGVHRPGLPAHHHLRPGLPQWRARAALALVAYNIMFVTPLIVVFLLAYFGTTSQQLAAWMKRRAAAVKLGMAFLFVLMAGWLGYSIVTL